MYGKKDKKLSFTTLVGSQNRHHEIGLHVTRTTDAQKGKSLHCMAEDLIPIANFQVQPKHILSAASAQFFKDIFDLWLYWVSVVRG